MTRRHGLVGSQIIESCTVPGGSSKYPPVSCLARLKDLSKKKRVIIIISARPYYTRRGDSNDTAQGSLLGFHGVVLL